MFTGIIESIGKIKSIHNEYNNLVITIESSISSQLKVDQSIAHNGICLTVVALKDNAHTVVAIQETLLKTNIKDWKINDEINLERAMTLGSRLDGHIVQGHIDQVGYCINRVEQNGSWFFTFEYDEKFNNITIEKGSVTLNGVSLTVVNSGKNTFSVAIIPYTFENTQFKNLNTGDKVNIEFDVIGKYVARLYEYSKK